MHYTFMFALIVVGALFGSIMLIWARRDARRQRGSRRLSGVERHARH